MAAKLISEASGRGRILFSDQGLWEEDKRRAVMSMPATKVDAITNWLLHVAQTTAALTAFSSQSLQTSLSHSFSFSLSLSLYLSLHGIATWNPARHGMGHQFYIEPSGGSSCQSSDHSVAIYTQLAFPSIRLASSTWSKLSWPSNGLPMGSLAYPCLRLCIALTPVRVSSPPTTAAVIASVSRIIERTGSLARKVSANRKASYPTEIPVSRVTIAPFVVEHAEHTELRFRSQEGE